MYELYFMEIGNRAFNDDIELCYLVSEQRRLRISNMLFDLDKKVCLYSDLLLRYLVCKKYGRRNSELQFLKNEFGKPFLVNESGFKYSISHTKNAIVLAVSDDDVGVDVEKKRDINFEIAKRFFTKNEVNYICEGDSVSRFWEIWTKKEAYVKYIGKGFSVRLDSFDVLKDETVNLFSMLDIEDYRVSVYGKGLLPKIVVTTEQQLLGGIESIEMLK